jgi:RNA polymerase primary sigma factor
LQESVQEAMQGLSERQQVVLRMRFGLDGGGALTLAGVGAVLGVGPERIRQIEAQALRKLRHPSRSGILRDYMALEQ